MNTDRWIALVSIVIGLGGYAIAFWQWHETKKHGYGLYHFLLGLKSDNQLSTKAEGQINDMLAWLKPPKKK
jgi:hypothetical protein